VRLVASTEASKRNLFGAEVKDTSAPNKIGEHASGCQTSFSLNLGELQSVECSSSDVCDQPGISSAASDRTAGVTSECVANTIRKRQAIPAERMRSSGHRHHLPS
jgi:hypothetical protein